MYTPQRQIKRIRPEQPPARRGVVGRLLVLAVAVAVIAVLYVGGQGWNEAPDLRPVGAGLRELFEFDREAEIQRFVDVEVAPIVARMNDANALAAQEAFGALHAEMDVFRNRADGYADALTGFWTRIGLLGRKVRDWGDAAWGEQERDRVQEICALHFAEHVMSDEQLETAVSRCIVYYVAALEQNLEQAMLEVQLALDKSALPVRCELTPESLAMLTQQIRQDTMALARRQGDCIVGATIAAEVAGGAVGYVISTFAVPAVLSFAGAATGAATGATVGSVVPGVGTAIGVVAGVLGGAAADMLITGRTADRIAEQTRGHLTQLETAITGVDPTGLVTPDGGLSTLFDESAQAMAESLQTAVTNRLLVIEIGRN